MSLQRTQHRNLVTGADLSGSTAHRESRVDLEDYVDPIAAARTRTLHGAGVADGLRVTAAANTPGVRVAPGVAVDTRGRTVVLEEGGVAVTAPTADGTNARNLATVAVAPDGVPVDTAGLTGPRLLTLAWAEAEAGGATLLRHAPWLQLLPAGDPATGPGAVVLAQVVLDAAGAVTALTAGARTPVPTPTGRLQLHAVRATPGPALAVEQAPVAELRGRTDGGLAVLPGGTAKPALTVDGTGAVSTTTLRTGGLTAAVVDTDSLRAGELTARTLTVTGQLRVKTLTVVDEGVTEAGAWANLGSNAFFDGTWKRLDPTRAGVSLHMNADGDGAEFRFGRTEPDESVPSNIATIGSSRTVLRSALHVALRARTTDTETATTSEIFSEAGTPIGLLSRATSNGSGDVTGLLAVAQGSGPGTKIALHAATAASGGRTRAGVFEGRVDVEGDLNVTGVLSKSAGQFLIDHPQDPENRLLRHSFVESPEALCVYRGRARLDERGATTVGLPSYFPALTDEDGATVHLTPVGEVPSPVSFRWNDGHTAVRLFGAPHAEVAYLVLAARDDPVARRLARPVEEDKDEGERGTLLFPEAFGYPPERGVDFALRRSVLAADGAGGSRG